MTSDAALADLDPVNVYRTARAALDEDLRCGPDATTLATVPAGARASGVLATRGSGVLAGLWVAEAVLAAAAGERAYTFSPAVTDGDRVAAGTVVAHVEAPARELLTAERTLLNLVSHLSGVATSTRRWVDAVNGTGCVIRDTRKTLPGLRALQKYAVRCGGGTNHRMGLGDAVLIKDNHVAAAGSITAAVLSARAHAPGLACEVEVDSLTQLDEALTLGVELVLLDNMTVSDCADAVRRARGSDTRLEVSGGLAFDLARAYAETGVDYLAVGSLTHSTAALDIGLDL